MNIHTYKLIYFQGIYHNHEQGVEAKIVFVYHLLQPLAYIAERDNGSRNIMEDQYALKLALWQTSLFRLQNVILMRRHIIIFLCRKPQDDRHIK